MKNFLLLSALIVMPVQAEKVVFEYTNPEKNQTTNIEGSVLIDIVTGDIKVTPSSDLFIVPSQPAVLGINADKYQVESGETVNVNWEVALGESCQGTVESGSVTGWSGNLSDGIGYHSKNVVVNSFPAVLRITCQNYDAYQQSQSSFKELVISEVQDVVVVNPSIVYLKANNSNNSTIINQADDVDITWSVNDSTSCSATSSPTNSDWNHNFNPNSSGTKSVSISETTTLTLTCGSATKDVLVTLDESGPAGCSASVYPPNLNIRSYTYEGLKDGHSFGDTTNGSVLIDLNNADFASILIGNLANNYSRRINFVTPPTDKNKTYYTSMSVSTCPGDFNTQTAACVKLIDAAQNPNVYFTTKSSDPSNYCKLDANTPYYINFVNKQFPNSNDSPRCKFTSDSECSIFFSESAN